MIVTLTAIVCRIIIRCGRQHAIATQQLLEPPLTVESRLLTILYQKRMIEENRIGITTMRMIGCSSVPSTITL